MKKVIKVKDIDEIVAHSLPLVNKMNGELNPNLVLLAGFERWLSQKGVDVPFEVELNPIESYTISYDEEEN